MIPGLILTFLRDLPWKWIGLGAGVVGVLWFTHHRGYQAGVASQAPVITSLNATIANVRAASAKALADDLAHKQAVEARQDRISKESNDVLSAQLADARARADDLSRRLLAASATDSRGGAAAGVSSAPAAADPVAGPGQASVMAADNIACAEAVTKAQGWQDWWRSVSQVAR